MWAQIAEAALQIFGAVSQQVQAELAAKNEMLIDTQQAGIAAAEGLGEEEIQRKLNREKLGRIQAGLAQSGTGGAGSSALVLDQAIVNKELDALHVRYKGQLTAFGYRERAISAALGPGSAGANSTLESAAALLKLNSSWNGGSGFFSKAPSSSSLGGGTTTSLADG